MKLKLAIWTKVASKPAAIPANLFDATGPEVPVMSSGKRELEDHLAWRLDMNK
jgi:hypothetical protein